MSDFYSGEGRLLRVIKREDGRVLVVDCLKKTMPEWVGEATLDAFEAADESAAKERLGAIANYDELDPKAKKAARERYASISGVLPFVGDMPERAARTRQAASDYKVSKETIRQRLVAYLIWQDIGALAPKPREERELTSDERNFRWALNRFYYRPLKLSLAEAYRRMLKERYCDETGKLLANRPSFRRFYYFAKKRETVENKVISREGKGAYARDHRPITGSVRDYCPGVGYGMVDSTVCDVYLVDDAGQVAGRPILAACVDGYSSMCMGYSLGFEGGMASLRKLMQNVIADKAEWCSRFGVKIEKGDWDCSALPHKLITDRGAEYVSDEFSQLADLGVELVNLPPYRPDLKGIVERFFGEVQWLYKKELASRGAVMEANDGTDGFESRRRACLTMREFERILLLCIVHCNTKRVIKLPYERLSLGRPFANVLWNAGLRENPGNVIEVGEEALRLTLLPRAEGTIGRDGLRVGALRYSKKEQGERHFGGTRCEVAYDPADVGTVWLLDGGRYVPYSVVDKYFEGLGEERAAEAVAERRSIERLAREESEQSRIDLSREIERSVAGKGIKDE